MKITILKVKEGIIGGLVRSVSFFDDYFMISNDGKYILFSFDKTKSQEKIIFKNGRGRKEIKK